MIWLRKFGSNPSRTLDTPTLVDWLAISRGRGGLHAVKGCREKEPRDARVAREAVRDGGVPDCLENMYNVQFYKEAIRAECMSLFDRSESGGKTIYY